MRQRVSIACWSDPQLEIHAFRFHVPFLLRSAPAARWRPLAKSGRASRASSPFTTMTTRWRFSKSIYKQLGLDEKFMQYRAALSRISHAKSHQETPQDWYKPPTDPKLTRLAKIYEQYEKRCARRTRSISTISCLNRVRLLKHDEALRDAYNRRFEFVMIDEYQDTNRSQYELMRLLTEVAHNVCVVGDEDQSIYGGAAPTSATFWISSAIFRKRRDPAGAKLPLDEEHSGSRERGCRE